MRGIRGSKSLSSRLAPLVLLWTAVVLATCPMISLRRELHPERAFEDIFLAHGEILVTIAQALWLGTAAACVVGIMWLAGVTLGRYPLNVLLGSSESRAVRLLWHSTFGLGVFGIILAGLGFTGLLRPALLTVFLAIAGTAGIPVVIRHVRGWRLSRPPLIAGTLCIFALAGMIVAAMVPEIELDSLHYHLGKTELYRRSGRLLAMPFNFHFYFQPIWELLILPPLLVAGEPAAKLMNPLVVLLAAAHLRSALSFTGRSGGWIAAALFLSGGLVNLYSASLKNDLLLALFAFAGLVAILDARRKSSMGWALVGGCLFGFALGVKYTALLTVVATFTGLVIIRHDRSRLIPALKIISFAIIGGFLVFLPWLLKGFLESANPLYPLATAWLDGGPGRTLSDWARWMMKIESHSYTVGSYASIADKLRAPWTLATVEFPAPSLLPILALPAAAILLASRQRTSLWAALSLISLALWTFGPPQARFLIQSLPIMAAALELALGIWPASSGTRKWLSALILCGAVFEILFVWICIPAGDRPARLLTAMGLVKREVYSRARLTSYADAMRWADRHLPEKGKILIFSDSRSVPLTGRALSASYAQSTPFLDLAAESFDMKHLRRKLRQLGVTHLLYNRMHVVFNRAKISRNLPSERALNLWARYWQSHAKLIYESPKLDLYDGAYYIYALGKGPPKSASLVLPGVEGWLYIPEYLLANHDPGRARAVFARIAKIAGDVDMVHQAYAILFREYLTLNQRRAILEKADLNGLKSVSLYLELADIAQATGNHALADDYFKRARMLDPRQARRAAYSKEKRNATTE